MLNKERFSSFKKPSSMLMAFLAVIFVSSALIVIVASKSIDASIQNSGKITLVGLEAHGGDIDSSNGMFSVDLGKIYVGVSSNVSFYLRSISNLPTTIVFTIENWQPENVESFLLVSWNYSGQQIAPNEEISVRINLKIVDSGKFFDYLLSNQISSLSFSFGLEIQAVES
jgi:hypothetical protein